MREIRLSGSEGGEEFSSFPTPIIGTLPLVSRTPFGGRRSVGAVPGQSPGLRHALSGSLRRDLTGALGLNLPRACARFRSR